MISLLFLQRHPVRKRFVERHLVRESENLGGRGCASISVCVFFFFIRRYICSDDIGALAINRTTEALALSISDLIPHDLIINHKWKRRIWAHT